jgi:hypothetical protein
MCSGRVAVPAPSQESVRSCIHVLWISILSISTILRLDFGNVLTVWYVLPMYGLASLWYLQTFLGTGTSINSGMYNEKNT